MKGGKQTGKPEFAGANAQTLQMELLFDDFMSGGDVATSGRHAHRVGQADRRVGQEEEASAADRRVRVGRQPGPDVVPRLRQAGLRPSISLFDGSGMPLRATANVTLEEVPVPPKKAEPDLGRDPRPRGRMSSREGDSLASIAWREYEDPALWRGLAAFNGIDDPHRVRLGHDARCCPTADEATAAVVNGRRRWPTFTLQTTIEVDGHAARRRARAPARADHR